MTEVLPTEIITQSAVPLVPAPVPARVTPMELLNSLLMSGNGNANVDVLTKLADLQERFDRMEEAKRKNEARMAFAAALAAAKAEIPPIYKNSKVGYTPKEGPDVSYKHEDLGEMTQTIDPILGKHGLFYRYRPTQNNGVITIACIVEHSGGHFEEISLSAGADNSGKKNAIQSIGSTITYLQRYTLKLALGIAASKDNDGRGAEEDASDGARGKQGGSKSAGQDRRSEGKAKQTAFTKLDWLDGNEPVDTPDNLVVTQVMGAIKIAEEDGELRSLLAFKEQNAEALREFYKRNRGNAEVKAGMNEVAGAFKRIEQLVAGQDAQESSAEPDGEAA